MDDGRWFVQVDVGVKPDGGRDRRSQICKTKREAQRADAELQALKVINGGVSGKVKLDWFIENVWKPEKRPVCVHSTFRSYESHVRCYIRPALGDMYLCDIKHVHVQHMISACKTRKTAQNAKSTLYNVLQMAVDMGYAPRNAADSRNFQLPREKGKQGTLHGEWLTSFPDHIKVIEASRGTSAFPILVLGLCFGLRKGEILGLDWEHVDFEENCIHVVQTYVQEKNGPKTMPPKTVNSIRTIPMTLTARSYLMEMKPERVEGAIVRSSWGTRMSPSGASKAVARFTAKEDVPAVTILSLRHSFATSAIRAGINVVSVSKWLGHASVATTLDRYVKPLQQDLRNDVADVVEELYKGTGNAA